MGAVALYPGTFDPITNGHVDIVARATHLFDEVIVAIAANTDKSPMFDLAQRIDLARQALAEVDHVRVVGFSDLLIDCARREGASVILRGLRAVSDFDYEFQMAAMNRRLAPDLETVFLTPGEKHTFVSASLVREIARLGGDVSEFLHPAVVTALKDRLG